MDIKVNGKAKETAASNLAELAQELALPEKGVAVALNGKMVRRPEWSQTSINEGATILVIRATCGG